MLKARCASLKRNAQRLFLKYDPVSSMRSLLPFEIEARKRQWPESGNAGAKMQITNFEHVGDFMEAMNQDVEYYPAWPDEAILDLRMDLIREEVEELEEGVENRDMENVAKELTDILYVVYGMGHALGIDLDLCFDEVQESNMSKLGDDGHPIKNKKGKVVKGPNYFEPDLEAVLQIGPYAEKFKNG